MDLRQEELGLKDLKHIEDDIWNDLLEYLYLLVDDINKHLFSRNLESLQGAVFQMISHGLITAALFLSAGSLIDRMQTKNIDNFGGLWKQMPIFSVFFMVFLLRELYTFIIYGKIIG